jgi:ABC-type nitrate/sulfonate/bicarbonate transport system ATPase subunit
MQQRVAIARALMHDAVLMDEPFGALDAMTRGREPRDPPHLGRSRQDHLFVTHSIPEACSWARRCWCCRTSRAGWPTGASTSPRRVAGHRHQRAFNVFSNASAALPVKGIE